MGDLWNFISGGGILSLLSEGLLAVTSVVIMVEGWFITQISNGLNQVLTWQNVNNSEVVLHVWTYARDITNLFFIVGLIIVSFATIFRAFGFLKGYYWKESLPRLLAAAILINLSLGLSETVVLISNRVTSLMADSMTTLGNDFARAMGYNALITSPLVVTDIEPASRDLGMNFSVKAPDGSSLDTWLANRENRTEAEEQALQECLEEETDYGWTPNWLARRWTEIPRKSYGACIQELAMVRRGERDVSFGERLFVEIGATTGRVYNNLGSKTTPEQSVTLAMASVSTVFMLAMVIISLGSAVTFFLFRIIAIWILMGVSAFAFGLMWVRGNDWFSQWWKYFLGWNVFGPYYLLVLIFGMTFLSRQSELMTSLAGANAGIGTSLFQTLLFFIFAALVFVGGLMLALNSSFATAVKSTPLIGRAAGAAGAFSAIALSTAFGRRVAQRTGVPATAQATYERLRQEYSARRPEFLRIRSDEEQLAEARRRLGVRGGAQEQVRLLTDRVKAQRDSIKKGVDSITDKDPKTQFDKQNRYLRSQMGRGDRSTRMAAGEMLMERGELSVDEVKNLQRQYPAGIGQAEFRSKVQRELPDKDPDTAYQFELDQLPADKRNDPAEQRKILQRFYGRVMNNPGAFSKLSPKYFNEKIPGATEKIQNMQNAFDIMYPASNAEELKQRRRAVANLKKAVRDQPDKLAFMEKISDNPNP
ncbi:MAG TPA: hypothetical protein VD862_01370 [Candidatus Paceibacterota bacterium]|nr:hypothetical protein [Candidatus Paceibacterota bacterium]